MAKKSNKTKLSISMIVAIAVVLFVIIFATNNSTAQFHRGTGYVDKAMSFAIDAWGYEGWGDCSGQTGGKNWADAYCKCIGYDSAVKCYHAYHNGRWIWDFNTGTCSSKKGTYTKNGLGFDTVRCKVPSW